MRWWAFSILGGLALGACSRSPAPSAAPEPVASAASAATEADASPPTDTESATGGDAAVGQDNKNDLTLVWTRDKTKQITTHFLDSTGKDSARAGLYIAAGATLLRWESKIQKQKAEPCPAGNPNPYTEYSLEKVSLQVVGEARSLPLLPLPVSEAAQAEDHSEIARDEYSPVASLGRYLFARGGTAFWPCGMHPQYGAAFYPFEIGPDGRATAVKESELFAGAGAGFGEAIRRLNAHASADPDSPDGVALENAVSTSMAFPSFASAGLGWNVQYTTTASWAGSFGDWSGYTRSVVVTLPTLPSKVRSEVPLAERALAYLRAHPGADIGGVSRGAVQIPSGAPAR